MGKHKNLHKLVQSGIDPEEIDNLFESEYEEK